MYRFFLLLLLTGSWPLAGQPSRTIGLLGGSILDDLPLRAPAGLHLVVTAIPDFTSHQLSWVLAHHVIPPAPEAVYLLGGAEDFLLHIAPERVAANLLAIADTLAGRDIRPVVFAILPHHHADSPEVIALANTALAQACTERGYAFVDLRPHLAPGGQLDRGYAPDGYHLNAAGRAHLAACLQAVMADTACPPPPPVPPMASPQPFYPATLSRHRIARILRDAPAQPSGVMLGNSITEQGDWAQLLGRADVRNCGQGGYTTGQMLWHLDTTVIAAQPRHCLIMGGINDLTVGVAPDQIYANLTAIAHRLQAAGIQPVLQSTLLPHDDSATQAVIQALNTRLAAWAQREGLAYLDLNAHLSGEKGLLSAYTTDGVHLNAAGYAAWASLLRTAGWGEPSPAPAYLLDADTGNELDDLYAITLALAPGGLPLVGLASAHFNNP